jgi:hypothetical protein
VLIRLRPNWAYLRLLLLAGVLVALTLTVDGALGLALTIGCSVLLALLGYPVVLSTLFRVPVLAVTGAGLRMPLMGVRLPWSQITGTSRVVRPERGRRADTALLLIHPADPQATLRQVRPWLRRETRQNLARYGSPIVVSDLSLDRSLAEIEAAIAEHLPRR